MSVREFLTIQTGLKRRVKWYIKKKKGYFTLLWRCLYPQPSVQDICTHHSRSMHRHIVSIPHQYQAGKLQSGLRLCFISVHSDVIDDQWSILIISSKQYFTLPHWFLVDSWGFPGNPPGIHMEWKKGLNIFFIQGLTKECWGRVWTQGL